MANEEVFGARFEIDITNLKSGITEANRYIRLAESEFKAAAAGMDDWRKSEDGLLAKHKQLTSTLQMQRAKVKALEKVYADTAREMGENSAEAMNLKIRLNKAQAEFNKTEKELKDVDNALEEFGQEASEAGTKIKNAANDAEKASGKFSKLGDAAKAGVAGLGAAMVALPASILALSEATEEYTQDIAQLENAFTTQGHTIETAHAVYDDFNSLLGDTDQAVEAANNLSRLTTNQDELAKWTNISAGAFSQFQNALPIENLAEGAAEAAKTGTAVSGLTDAINWSTASNETWSASMAGNKPAQDAFNKALADGATREEAFNAALQACSSEQERSTLITESLSAAYGEAGATYRENNKDLLESRQAQDDWNAAMAGAGEAVRPIATALMEFGAQLLNSVLPSLQSFADGFKARLEPAFNTFKDVILPPVQAAFQWFMDNLPTIAPIVAGIATAFAAYAGISAIVTGVTTALNLLRNGTLLMTIAQTALNRVMNMNPFVLIASLIAGLVVALVGLWNTNEGFRNAVINAWNSIKSVAESVFSGIAKFISGVWSGIVNGVKSVISGVTNTFNNIKNKIKSIMDGVRNTVKGVIDKIKGFFNFKVSLPKIKLPRFSISPAGWELGDLLKGSIPKLSIAWNAEGAIFKRPTLFATPNAGVQGVGEAGAEAVAPIDKLIGYVRSAVREEMNGKAGSTFIQNNYSPKALTPYDTYRQGLKLNQMLGGKV